MEGGGREKGDDRRNGEFRKGKRRTIKEMEEGKKRMRG